MLGIQELNAPADAAIAQGTFTPRELPWGRPLAQASGIQSSFLTNDVKKEYQSVAASPRTAFIAMS
ncbi:MAG: hypothetical protein ACR2GP_11700 [Burkholderiaceae bacterium]